MKDDRLYVVHIRECIERIEEYTGDGKDRFLSTSLVQDAVLRNLQTMAESTQRLSASLKAAHPEAPWRELSGFRNVLTHDYLGLDIERIWGFVENRLPAFKKRMDTIARELGL